MTEEVKKPRAKRKINKMDFSGQDAAVALVGNAVGGAANGHTTLLVKNTDGFSEETIKKASTIKVELSIEEFLQKFFNLYWEDAEILARVLGFTTMQMEYEEDKESIEVETYESWIQEKVKSFEIMKSLKEGNAVDVLSSIDENAYIQLLEDQNTLEKAFVEVQKSKESTSVEDSAEAGKPQIVDEVASEATASITKQAEETMEANTEVKEEQIAKAAFVELEKAFNEQKVALEKALEAVAKFEAEKKEAIQKARHERIVLACGEQAEEVFKAVADLDQEKFDVIVKAFSALNAKIEKSAAFEEIGASVETAEVEESAVAKLIKAKFGK